MKPRSPIEMMIDAACGYNPDAPPEPLKLAPEQKEACKQLGSEVLSDLRFAYPDVVKTRPTTWPVHLRNTIANKAELMLREILEEKNTQSVSNCSVVSFWILEYRQGDWHDYACKSTPEICRSRIEELKDEKPGRTFKAIKRVVEDFNL